MILNNCTLIGLTGGIATGKSTVTKILTEKGYTVIDADKISREVVQQGKPAYNEIVETFGVRILLEDKSLNRRKLGRLIFNSSCIRYALNKIVHPRVIEVIKQKILDECKDKNNGERIIFLDIPLLFEVLDLLKLHDIELKEIWMVYTDKNTQLRRLMERDNINKEEAMNKINSQQTVDEKRMKSSKTLYNNGNIEELKSNLEIILSEFEV